MEEELEHDAEGNVIPLLRQDGSEVCDPVTGLQRFQPRIDPKSGKPYMRPVMTWGHREPDANTLKWLASHQYSDEFGDAPDKMISITAVTNDRTMQTISTRVEAYQKKREMLPAPVSDDVSDVEVVEVKPPRGAPRGHPRTRDARKVFQQLCWVPRHRLSGSQVSLARRAGGLAGTKRRGCPRWAGRIEEDLRKPRDPVESAIGQVHGAPLTVGGNNSPRRRRFVPRTSKMSAKSAP
jgi:hypothetical protein